MSEYGRVEILSTEFAAGWAACDAGQPAHVMAVLGAEVVGVAVARFTRQDLDEARARGELDAYAFTIVFSRPVALDQLTRVRVILPSAAVALPMVKTPRIDRSPPLRVFLLGSPRSGTSAMGETLASVLGLPWDGEGHAAPLFAAAAEAMDGNAASTHSMVRFIAAQGIAQSVRDLARQTYYTVHSSASFLDKTPGCAMVHAAPFLAECFPDARFIFVRRHPVANVLSRMAKFGGAFEEHCTDWAAIMDAWLKVRFVLPHNLEIEQEAMATHPLDTAQEIAEYLGVPDLTAPIGASLSSGIRERTGAGLGKRRIAEAGWTAGQIAVFERHCLAIMRAYGYES